MEIYVEFDSILFQPFLPENSQVNPNIYGAELAFWLSKQLAIKGIITSYPHHEDWGWFLEYITDLGDEYWLCCGNREGSSNRWLCYFVPKPKSLFKFNTPRVENAQSLLDTLNAVLHEALLINNIHWSNDFDLYTQT